MSKLKLQQVAVISIVYKKKTLSSKYPKNTLYNKNTKLLLPFISWNFYTKNTHKCNKIWNWQQNPCVKINKLTPAKKMLHIRFRCCRRHLKGLSSIVSKNITSFHTISNHLTKSHIISHNFTQFHIISHNLTSFHTILHISNNFTSFNKISHNFTQSYIILSNLTSYNTISLNFTQSRII